MLTERKWRIEGALHLYAALAFALCTAGLLLPWLAPPDEPAYKEARFWFFTLNTGLFHAVALFFVGAFLHLERMSWSEAFGLSTPGKVKALTLALVTAVLALPVSWLLIGVLSAGLRAFSVEPVVQQAVTTLQETRTLQQRAIFGIVAVVLAPVVEEVLFRGILYPTVKQAGFPRIALWGTSLFFALTHANFLTFIPLTVLALALVWLYERTNNLAAPVVTHALFNAANFAYLIQQT